MLNSCVFKIIVNNLYRIIQLQVLAGFRTQDIFAQICCYFQYPSLFVIIIVKLFIGDKIFNKYFLNNILTKAQAINAAAARSGIPASDVPSEPMKLAMTVVATGPIVLLYPFLQKYFVKGVTIGAVKG